MKSLLENSKYPLSHSGVAHDENPPGRGSGRYAWGSGKRPFQSLKEKREVKKQVRKTKEYKQIIGTQILTSALSTAGGIAVTAFTGNPTLGLMLADIGIGAGLFNSIRKQSVLNSKIYQQMKEKK